MLARGTGILLTLAFVSVAQAGAVIELVPDNPGPYSGGESITVDFMLSQDAPAVHDILARMIQFDMNASDPGLEMTSFRFQYYEFDCLLNPVLCPLWHVESVRLDDEDGKVVTTVFIGTDTDVLRQTPLPVSGSTNVGHLELMLPTTPGLYTLDALNAQAEDVMDAGAQIMFGFGGADPVTHWRATEGSITGGQYTFEVIPEPTTLALMVIGALTYLRRRRR